MHARTHAATYNSATDFKIYFFPFVHRSLAIIQLCLSDLSVFTPLDHAVLKHAVLKLPLC